MVEKLDMYRGTLITVKEYRKYSLSTVSRGKKKRKDDEVPSKGENTEY